MLLRVFRLETAAHGRDPTQNVASFLFVNVSSAHDTQHLHLLFLISVVASVVKHVLIVVLIEPCSLEL
jgi:hypothetical protein